MQVETGQIDGSDRRALSSAAHRRAQRARAFTLLELLVVILIIGVLMGILLPVVTRVRASAKTVSCISNLRQIATSFQQYAQDNGDRLPDASGGDESWETMLLKYVRSRGLYVCPADQELSGAVGSSYDWRDTGNPATTLAGQPITDVRDRNAVLVFDALPNWHAKKKMNAARIDGSVETVDEQECLEDLTRRIRRVTTQK